MMMMMMIFLNEHILLITVPTIKILFTINSIKKKLFLQTTDHKHFRLKKTLS